MYEMGECMIEPTHENFQFVCDLTKTVPLRFEVTKSNVSSTTLHLIAHFDTGSKCQSWAQNSKFNFESKTEAQQLNDAMRWAVRTTLFDWKDTAIDICAKCDSLANLHVDHIIPFDFYKKAFLRTASGIPTAFDESSSFVPCFKESDEAFKTSWKYYHDSQATFQYLCRTCNLKKSNNIACKEWIKTHKTEYNLYHKNLARQKRVSKLALRIEQQVMRDAPYESD
jgi:5-methylcytosine-specific restriction endonuclease McrA